MITAIRALQRWRWAIICLLAGAVSVFLLAPLVGSGLSPVSASGPHSVAAQSTQTQPGEAPPTVSPPAETPTTATPAAGAPPAEVGPVAVASDDAIPDAVILVPPGEQAGPQIDSLVAALTGVRGIVWAAGDLSVQPGQVLVAFEGGSNETGLRGVQSVIAAQPAPGELVLAGRALTDQGIGQRIGLAAFMAGVLASLAVGALVSWLIRLPHGLLAGANVALSALMGGVLGSKAAGSFDGSVATTAVPALLAAVLVATYLVFRLLSWFVLPEGKDQTDVIRGAILSVGVELALFFAGLAVVSVFLGVVGSGRSVAPVVFVGALTAAISTLAIVPAALAMLHDSGLDAGSSAFGDSGSDQPGALLGSFAPFGIAVPGPDGRHYPLGLLVGLGGLLGLFGLFSLQATSPAQLLDEGSLASRSASAELPQLLTAAGDPTAAVLAAFDPGVDQLAKAAWLERVSLLPGVSRIETATGRYAAGALVDGVDSPLAAAGVGGGDEAPQLALVVPSVTSRSSAAQDLVAAIEATNAPVDAELSGAPVDAGSASQSDNSSVWLTIITLAIISGAAIFGLIGDAALAASAAGLRILGSAAAVGIYHLLVGEATGAELQLVVLVSALGCALFELGFLRRLLQGHHVDDTEALLDQALHREGWAAVVGLVVTAVASLGLVAADLPVIRRLGLLLVVTILIEVMVGLWLLRPPVLGTRAIRHLAAQPVRAALRSLLGGGGVDPAAQEQWNTVVADLLQLEFSLQTDPEEGDLERVFVTGTPLFRKAVDHHQNLAQAGLRIVGRNPQLRTLRVVDSGSSTTIAVTVDHPPRQLVNREGAVLGLRKPERRSVMLWLAAGPDDGTYRIADTVELGVEPLSPVVRPSTAGVSSAGASGAPS